MAASAAEETRANGPAVTVNALSSNKRFTVGTATLKVIANTHVSLELIALLGDPRFSVEKVSAAYLGIIGGLMGAPAPPGAFYPTAVKQGLARQFGPCNTPRALLSIACEKARTAPKVRCLPCCSAHLVRGAC